MARGMNVTVVRSKICGITRIEDALAAVEAGADAIGLVFYGKSPRAVSIEQAAAILQALPPFVTSVGLFVDMPHDELQQLLQRLPLDLLQFHGDESPADCEGHGRPYIKALRVRPGEDVSAAMAPYAGARGILLDTFVEGVPGGTGASFDWSLVPENAAKPIILAGGLDAGNVATAIRQVRPYAVDVSGGVEAGKGIKDAGKIRAFVRAVRDARCDGD
ncbi:phosphoribosylanthranilate isomerase [Ectopseudomonas oleovorans]|uniref:N-(5'-phosphoribosyl)anthranilate isomerase n=2 Tax=Pseudomonadaceae TaxID=135621 RepID=A0A2S7FPM1_ECTOL|nr:MULTISPECIES: phosphoribosylanthranilate isomerase [Pseudomonas]MBP8883842.1 phosphoribosylanthranilate isomerase [Pseudomonas sp.]AXO61984.1 phosphoribosylanthranilate isomerase [Pseudomonas sp. phDV1]MBN7116997.1 N-(5'-phosphoribosyl)anthranilate isomerase [Pseudomonas oleovorans]MBN7131619.1 N-(5'-phosphoribosyl)anthranilate isomerase [Pseudomonas oleovorans]MBN7140161.1 N-(5'-phosphoribosyl)anthranilate isomerase [Pseudomonas oleovorans]